MIPIALSPTGQSRIKGCVCRALSESTLSGTDCFRHLLNECVRLIPAASVHSAMRRTAARNAGLLAAHFILFP